MDTSGLLEALFKAHHESAFRDNASSVAVKVAADASGDLCKAIVAGISTMGGKHAPIEETIRFLERPHPDWFVKDILKAGLKVPGWGGTFQKEAPDPLWAEVDKLLAFHQPELHHKLERVTSQLLEHGKPLWPNPSAYTACVAIAAEIPAKLAPYLFIRGRLSGWMEIAAQCLVRKEL